MGHGHSPPRCMERLWAVRAALGTQPCPVTRTSPGRRTGLRGTICCAGGLVGGSTESPSPAGAWRREGSCRGLGHRVPSPSPHLHVRRAGKFPTFPVSKQPNFLHRDLRPHPGWGTHGSCQMSLRCPTPHRQAGDQSRGGGGQGQTAALPGLWAAIGGKDEGPRPCPQHPGAAGSVHDKQANRPCQPPQHVPQSPAIPGHRWGRCPGSPRCPPCCQPQVLTPHPTGRGNQWHWLSGV